MSKAGQIVAMGGGGFSMEPNNLLLDEYVLSLTEKETPRVCFVPTASGDSEDYTERFYHSFSELSCEPSDLQLFRRDIIDLEAFVMSQDVIYVGGGNTANLMAVWRLHHLIPTLRKALDNGTVLCGISAGMNCWFRESVTDSFVALTALHDGTGFLPGSVCPHYDGEVLRRPTYHDLIARGELSPGYAAQDSVALHFDGGVLKDVISSEPGKSAYYVELGRGGVQEKELPARYLGV